MAKIKISEAKPVEKVEKNKAGDYIRTGEIVEGIVVVWIEAQAEASSLENVGRAAQSANPQFEVRRINGPYRKDTGSFSYKVTLGIPVPSVEVENW